MRAKQRDVTGNGTERLYESPTSMLRTFFYEVRTLVLADLAPPDTTN